jgi:hypothetical protein
VRFGAKPVLDLRDTGQDEPIEVRYDPSLGSEHATEYASGTGLSDVLGLDSIMPSADGDFDRGAAAGLTEKTTVQKGGMRHVQGIFGSGVQRAFHHQGGVYVLVAGLRLIRQSVGPTRGCAVGASIDPNHSILVESRERHCFSRWVTGLATGSGHTDAFAGGGKAPPVIRALEGSRLGASEGEGSVTVRATVEEGGWLAQLITKKDNPLVKQSHRARSGA